MKFRLSGWQRVGIVASVLWALGAGLVVFRNENNYAHEARNITYMACIHDRSSDECVKEAWDAYQWHMQGIWRLEVFVALVPIPIAWLLAYMFIGVWRWVRRGGF